VDEEDRERLLGRLRMSDLAIEDVVEIPRIVEAGRVVDVHEMLDALVLLDVLSGHLDLSLEHLEPALERFVERRLVRRKEHAKEIRGAGAFEAENVEAGSELP